MTATRTEKIIENIKAAEKNYRPSQEVADSLSQKTLVMLVGPVAVGKSFVSNLVAESDPEFNEVSVFTTREARASDGSGLFRIKPHTDESLSAILDEIKAGTLVQYMVHTTTGRIYGSTVEDYSGTYNLLPTISSVVDQLTQLPFKAATAIYVTTRPEVWIMWLNTRYPDKEDTERAKRIEEAIVSLEWALADERQSTVSWIENDIQTPEKTVEDVINIVKYNQQYNPVAREYAKQMLELAINER
jgi:hypothetical protein